MNIKLSDLQKQVVKQEPQKFTSVRDLNQFKLNEIHEYTKTPKNPEGFSYEGVIRMTAAKFTCWCVEFDDIYNELISFFLGVIKKYSDNGPMSDGWDNFTYGLDDPIKFTFKIIKNKAIDIYRKSKQEYDAKLQLFEEVDYEDESSSIGIPEEEGYLAILQQEFRDQYPVMSRPWIYITLKFAAAGIIPESELSKYGLYLPKHQATTGPKTDIRDVDIITQMGFKGTKPSSYYTLKSEVKEELIRFFNGENLFDL